MEGRGFNDPNFIPRTRERRNGRPNPEDDEVIDESFLFNPEGEDGEETYPTDSDDSEAEEPDYDRLFAAQFRGDGDEYDSYDSDYSDEEEATVTEKVRLPPDSPTNVRGPDDPLPKDSVWVRRKIARGETVVSCHLCGKRYCTAEALRKHIDNYHFTVPKKFSCPKCGRDFKQNSVYRHHYKNAECERTWKFGSKQKTLPKKQLQTRMKADKYLENFSPAALFLYYYMGVLRVMIDCTNIRAPELFDPDHQKHLKARQWTPLTVNRGLKFTLACIALSFLNYKDVRDPWRKGDLFSNKFLKKIMSGNEFNQIRRALCFCVPQVDTLPGNIGDPKSPRFDPMWRVTRIINTVVVASQRAVTMGMHVCIDEAMIPYKGKTKLKSYIPNKPHPIGLKLYVLADPRTGYIFNIIPCSGKRWPFMKKLGVIASIVIALLKGTNIPGYTTNLLNRCHVLVTDNFYTSFKLMEWLLSKLTYMVGTLRVRRRAPKNMENGLKRDGRTKMVRGNSKTAVSNTSIHLTTWLDNKRVMVASTFPYITNQLRVCTRHLIEKPLHIYRGLIQCLQPVIVKFYTMFMGGVDRGNQKLSYYHFQPRSRRWTMAVFYAMLDICVFQAHLIHKIFNPKTTNPKNNWTIREFKLLLITDLETQLFGNEEEIDYERQLMNRYPLDAIEPRDLVEVRWKEVVSKLRLDHSVFHSKCTLDRRRTCVFCKDRNRKTKESCYICKVAMHDTLCFFNFHNDKHFVLE